MPSDCILALMAADLCTFAMLVTNSFNVKLTDIVFAIVPTRASPKRPSMGPVQPTRRSGTLAKKKSHMAKEKVPDRPPARRHGLSPDRC